MATAPRTSTLPLPGAELERLKSTLARQYGSQLWEGAGQRILIVRVPRSEPDIIQDLETAVEHLAAGDTDDITAALLVGDNKPLAVPIHPFMQLMAQRVQFDEQQCRQLRTAMAPGSHKLYRAPGDPKKTLRLALRVSRPSVEDVEESDMDSWASLLGVDLDQGRLNGTRAVYLIADQDHARIGADLFFHDLRKQAADAKARHDMATQIAARQPGGGRTKPERVAHAPLRRLGDDEGEAAGDPQDTTAPMEPANPTFTALAARLRDLGFNVLEHPPGHAIDLAAERPDADPQRVIAWVPERVTPDVASACLATARKLDIDLALLVCDDVEPEARKRLIATKVRTLQVKDIANLDL